MATSENSARQPISPVVRKRLQLLFDAATKSVAKNDFKYASDMFCQCVVSDPGNIVYINNMLTSLARRYNDNKKGAGFTSTASAMGAKASIKKASMSKEWTGVVKSSVDMLQINPWDIFTLIAISDACEGLGHDEAQLTYLRWALNVNGKDVDVNRKAAKALARMGQFDQSIACWHRVEQAKPGDEEASRSIGDLTVQKTITKGGYDEATSSTDVMTDKKAQAERRAEAPVQKLSPQKQLEADIAGKPEELGAYLELAELHSNEERFTEAVKVLTKALQVAGGDVGLRERLEDAQLRQAQQQFQIAHRKAEKEKTQAAIDLAKKIKDELRAFEAEYYRTRSERHPNNATYRFELGVRLKKAGQYNEAINCLQKAAADPKRKAAVHMELGECFQYIKQFKLAMTNYVAAVESVSERDVEQRKLALYRAGKLALGLAEKYAAVKDAQAAGELARAEKYLNELAGMDFGYKDVPALLDKIAKMGDKV